MIKNIVWTVVFGLVAAILQSTLLSHLALYRAVPDIALGIIVYSAYVNGTMTGQVSGFLYGIVQDLLSQAPLGLNAFVRTIIGALAGLMKGTFFLDVFILPMLLCASATLLKAAILFLLSLLMPGTVESYSLFAPLLWTELAMNTFIAPFLFALLKRFSSLLKMRGAV
ncbi:MAG: rod shape-determining protein MreD [Treponema sp.]|jgi:rod shape-determining protein MreD|nr:rod shape-determining protein MreD [Treponema sp.]